MLASCFFRECRTFRTLEYNAYCSERLEVLGRLQELSATRLLN